MKNIIYKHLKTCVLSLCVAVLCGDKAFGEVYFRCACGHLILDVCWMDHCSGNHLKFCNLLEKFNCCQKDFDTLEKLEEHIKDKHSSERCFGCSKCNAKVSEWGRLAHAWGHINVLYDICDDQDDAFDKGYTDAYDEEEAENLLNNLSADNRGYSVVYKENNKTKAKDKDKDKAKDEDQKIGEGNENCGGGSIVVHEDGTISTYRNIHTVKGGTNPFNKDKVKVIEGDEEDLSYKSEVTKKHVCKIWTTWQTNVPKKNKKPFCCNECKDKGKHVRMFNINQQLEHLKKEHPDILFGDFSCQYCNNMVVPRKEWNNHVEKEHKKNKHWLKMDFVCPKCNAELERETGNACKCESASMYCQPCDKMISKGDWNEHVKAKHGNNCSEMPFVCMCNCIMKWKDKRNHMMTRHSDEYWCETCYESFPNQRDHFEKCHREKGFSCKVCNAFSLTKDGPEWANPKFHGKGHEIRCEICEGTPVVDEKHMHTVHHCGEMCQPRAIRDIIIWDWRHALHCKWTFKCALGSLCFAGNKAKVEEHMRERHQCTEECCVNDDKSFTHSNCNFIFEECRICPDKMIKLKLGEHYRNKHGCVNGCPIAEGGGGKWHNIHCREWLCKSCTWCGKGEWNRQHFIDHMNREYSKCKGLNCYFTQSQDPRDEGAVELRHVSTEDGKHKDGSEVCGYQE